MQVFLHPGDKFHLVAGGNRPEQVQGNPQGVVVDSLGDIFIADTANHVIREVDHTTHIISVVAGDGYKGTDGSGSYGGDGGLATAAELDHPQAIALDATGQRLFIADTDNSVIREVNLTGSPLSLPAGEGGGTLAAHSITTIAGSGVPGFSGNGGLATAATLISPASVAVDSAGDLFIADQGSDQVRMVSASTGNIYLVAGNPPVDTHGNPLGGFGGDGAAATAAELNTPSGVAVSADGSQVFIADTLNNRVRKVSMTYPGGTPTPGNITTVVGTGAAGFGGDGGLATSAQLFMPIAVALGGSGNLYVSDLHNIVREVNLNTSSSITTIDGGSLVAGNITTIAGILPGQPGNGVYNSAQDGGPALLAGLNGPDGLFVDASGNLFIAEAGGDLSNAGSVIREVTVVA